MSYSSQFFENKAPSEAVSRRRTDNAKENGQFSPVFRININKYMCLRQSSLFIFVVFYREKKEKFEDTKGR
jgi:hypothetical protein